MKSILRSVIGILLASPAIAQEKLPAITPYNYMDIRELYLDSANHHTALRTILRMDSTGLYGPDTTTIKRSWLNRKLFREHLFEFREPDFNVFVDLLPDLQVGRSDVGKMLWLNTRGATVKGNIGRKFYFESTFFENQGVFPRYIDEYVAVRRVIPGQGEAKMKSGKKYDYSYVSALINYKPSKYLDFVLGYGSNFFGDGYRSMILSDQAFSYPYLKITAHLGQFQYTSMWAQFMDLSGKSFSEAYHDLGYNKKWGVFHFLDWNASRKLTIGVFDAVIWPDKDTVGNKRGFDWSYLNPIIFLRPAEYSTGSSDNAMMGMNAKFKLLPRTTLYGQFVLDEFRLKEFLGGNGWWGNKWSSQLGFRSFDLFKVNKLDVQSEFNISRPYTYSFRNGGANYAHYNQPLAHPMGANFKEVIGIATYTYKRWYFRAQFTYANYGLEYSNDVSYGHDIFKSYDLRVSDYDIRQGQGIKTDFTFGQGTIAYVLNPKYNLRLEATVAGRQEKNTFYNNRELLFSFGLRSTFRQFYYDF